MIKEELDYSHVSWLEEFLAPCSLKATCSPAHLAKQEDLPMSCGIQIFPVLSTLLNKLRLLYFALSFTRKMLMK